jgi:aspartyl-tRNA(Asn)/glutamyl-tRNA(Gln) amidotransferase subunit A
LHGRAVEQLRFERGRRAAWTATLGHAIADPEVEVAAHDAAIKLCRDAGIDLVAVDVVLPNPARAWGILSSLDMVADHGARAAGRFDELTPVVRAGFESSARITGDAIVRALRRRNDMLAAIGAVFDAVDFLLTPTVAAVAFAADGPPPRVIAGRDVGGMGSVPFTAPFNVSGQPAVSIPCGLSSDGLPIGLQVVGRRHDDLGVLACGLVAEQRRPWPGLAPAYSH